MICQNCGTNNPDGGALCSNCGANMLAEENVVNAESNTPDNLQEELLVEQETEIKPKKKFKFPKKLVFIGVPVIAVVVAVILNWYILGGFFVKWFGSDADYFSYIEKNNAETSAHSISEIYGNMVSGLSEKEISSETEMKLLVGDKAFELIAGAYPGVDFDQFKWLKEIDLKVNTDFKDSNMQHQLGFDIGGQEIATLDFLADYIEGTAYLGLPGINDKYIKLENITNQETKEIFEALDSIKDELPEESAVKSLLEKYPDVVFECITDDYVNVKQDKIVANGVEQSCTVVKIEITDKLLLDIFEAILKTASDDKEFEKIVDQIQNAISEIPSAVGIDEMNFYDELSDGMSELLETIEKEKASADKETTILVLTDYINRTHEVIGRKIEIVNDSEPQEILFIGKAEGKEIGYEYWINVDGVKVQLFGTGSESWGGAVTGEFELVVSGIDGYAKEYSILAFETKDLDASEELAGFIKILPGKDFVDLLGMGSDVAAIKSFMILLDPSVEINLGSSFDSVKMSFKILSGNDMLLELAIKGKQKDDCSIEFPKESDVIDVENEDEWLETFDVDKLVERLKKAGLRSDLLDSLKDSFKA